MTLHARLKAHFPKLEAAEYFDFARHTAIGCGGTASAWAAPRNGEELALLLDFLRREHIPHCFLGAGANVLPKEGLFDGVVIRFCRMQQLCAEGRTVRVGAGVTGGRLLKELEARTLAGAEFLAGIPMTVGGAAAMNAGVREGHLGDLIESVTCAEAGRCFTLTNQECRFFEKDSIFLREKFAVTCVTLNLKYSFPEEIARRRCYFRLKRASLPKGRSMGCVFVNPEGRSAGALIDGCGLKGTRIGGAKVSELHANFILNEGGTSGDVAALIAHIQKIVCERTGILLREEIQRLP